MMTVKNNIRNIGVLFLFAIFFDIIYSVLGLLVIDNINIRTVSAITVIILLCGLFFSAIVIIPMILLLMTFGLSIIAVPVVSMLMQYPGIILKESFGIDMLLEDNPMLFYIIVILYHLMCCFSMYIGSYHKKHTKQQ